MFNKTVSSGEAGETCSTDIAPVCEVGPEKLYSNKKKTTVGGWFSQCFEEFYAVWIDRQRSDSSVFFLILRILYRSKFTELKNRLLLCG